MSESTTAGHYLEDLEKEWNNFRVLYEIPDTIFHYTSVEALFKILRSGELWATILHS